MSRMKSSIACWLIFTSSVKVAVLRLDLLSLELPAVMQVTGEVQIVIAAFCALCHFSPQVQEKSRA